MRGGMRTATTNDSFAPWIPAFVLPPPRRVPETPARRLMVAVFAQALADYRHGQPDVRRWLTSPRRDYCTSFAAICEALGIDPGCVRIALARGRAAGSARSVRRSRA